MHFTREPLVETIIIPKEGFKLLVRSSRQGAIEEFYVDSVQVVLMGGHCFYRSIEKPKPFLLPSSDYEVLEVKEARLQFKIPGKERAGIKIAGGREATLKASKEEQVEKQEAKPAKREISAEEPSSQEKPRDKKRRRFRKERKEGAPEVEEEPMREESPPPSLIPPPATLISESIAHYKDLPDFAGAFYEREEKIEDEAAFPSDEEENLSSDEAVPSEQEEPEDLDFLMP